MHIRTAWPTAVFLALLIAIAGCAGRVGGPTATTSPAVALPDADQPAAKEAAAKTGMVEAHADPVVHVTLVQLNDVYEITPVEGGRSGGLARVATLLDRLTEANPNTYALLSGDLLSPSAMGTAKVDGKRLYGKQMVAVLNKIGLDLATLGNHEFDLKQEDLEARLGESEFKWVCANATRQDGSPFPGVAPNEIVTFENAGGRPFRVGFFGLTKVNEKPVYERYADPVEVGREQVAELRAKVDALVAVTHLALDHDQALAESVAGIDLILGGHEHENFEIRRGPERTPILKADANAKTVWVHELRFDVDAGELAIDSRLEPITDAIPDQAETAAEVQRWVDAAFAGFRAEGFDPDAVVTTTDIPLDGREGAVRNTTTDLTQLIAEAIYNGAPGVDLAIYNSGSIRIDDVLAPGPVTQYDVIRVLPFGGDYLTVTMTGELLQKVLDQGVANRGSGGWLQHWNVTRNNGAWQVAGQVIDAAKTYEVSITDYLVSGQETGLPYLTRDNPELAAGDSHGDIRKAVIDQLVKQFGAP